MVENGDEMLRGVNRSIIEICETENKYFEKILIFVKPEYGSLSPSQLNFEAKRLMGSISFTPMGLNRNSARRRALLKRRRRVVLVAVAILATLVMIWKII